jgi:hypothetical protein
LLKTSQIILDEVREGKQLLLAELDRLGFTCFERIFETCPNLLSGGLREKDGL